MEFNRNQFFLIGLVVLFLGIEFRTVNSFVLTPELTQFLAKKTGHPIAAVNTATSTLFQTEKPLPMVKKTIRPPDFLGWAFLSAGAVLILHALAMPKPAS